ELITLGISRPTLKVVSLHHSLSYSSDIPHSTSHCDRQVQELITRVLKPTLKGGGSPSFAQLQLKIYRTALHIETEKYPGTNHAWH
ncbi:hypothetical protein J6590_066167, partial [Homalodisca vitripennis]